MRKYFKLLTSNSPQASSRRFIALLTLPLYLGGIVVGFVVGIIISDFRFYLAALLAAALPIFLAFFALTWQHVYKLLSAKIFQKRSDGLYELTPEETKDP